MITISGKCSLLDCNKRVPPFAHLYPGPTINSHYQFCSESHYKKYLRLETKSKFEKYFWSKIYKWIKI